MGCGCGAKGAQNIKAQAIPQPERVANKVIQTKSLVRTDPPPVQAISSAPQGVKCPKCNSHTIRVNISGRTRIQCSNNQCRKILS